MLYRKSKKCAIYILPIIIILIATLFAGCSKNKSEEENELLVQYFYHNICGSCEPEKEFMEQFEAITGISPQTTNVDVMLFNVYDESSEKIWFEVVDEFDIPQEKQNFPILRIGSKIKYISEVDSETGEKFIENAGYSENSIPHNASVIVYFFSPGCHDCITVKDNVLSKLPDEVIIGDNASPIHIINISISQKEGTDLFKKYCAQYYVKKEKQITPIVFIGSTALSGVSEIEKLPDYIENGEGLSTVVLDSNEKDSSKLEGYSFLGIIATGFLNGLNPCAISMMLMLLSLIAVDKKLVCPVGFSFTLGKFAGFLLIGTALYKVIEKIPFDKVALISKIILLTFAGLMVLLNLNDHIAARNEKYGKIKLQLPKAMRKKNHEWIKKFTSGKKSIAIVGAIALGVLISAGEFLCTGQIYLAVIVQTVNSGATLNGLAFWYLLIYCLAFISPILVATLLVAKGRRVFELSEKFRRNMAWVKLFNLVVFAIFFVLVILIY